MIDALIIFLVFCNFLIIRIEITSQAFNKQLDIISDKSDGLIESGREWQHLYKELKQRSRLIGYFDLTKWTHRQFFPDN